VRSRKPRLGGFGHHVCRYYGRCAGCCCWTGTGNGGPIHNPPRPSRRKHGPESKSLGVKPKLPGRIGQSRGGAPRGERARSEWPAQVCRSWRASAQVRSHLASAGGNIGRRGAEHLRLRLPALRLPSFIWRRIFFFALSWRCFLVGKAWARIASRGRGRLSSPAIAGEGDHAKRGGGGAGLEGLVVVARQEERRRFLLFVS
jgi:hypothetical protein